VQLSVLVTRQNARDPVDECLRSLINQASIGEIILLDGVGDDYHPPADARVRVMRFEAPASLPMLLATGIVEARGDIVAMTESHCQAAPDWAANVIAEHERTHQPVIGGVVEAGAGLGYVDFGLYVADYGAFMPPIRDGEADEMPGENVSFKREIFTPHLETIARDGFYKTLFCQDVQSAGKSLICANSIVMYYQRRIGLGALARRRFTHGRCFGAQLAKRLTPAVRWARVGGDLLLPAVLMIRLMRKTLPKRAHTPRVIAALPVVLLATVSWAAGEWIGNLFGAGDSCRYV